MYKWFLTISFKNGTSQDGYLISDYSSSTDVIKEIFEGNISTHSTIQKNEGTVLGYCIGDVSWYTLSTKTP